MRALCLLLILCAACGKKPAPKPPVPNPPAGTKASPDDKPPDSKPVERKGDPCEGGEKPH